MELKLNNGISEKEAVYYVFSIMIFLSSFYIAVNLLTVNLIISLALFNVLILASGVYVLNVEKYSIFKQDMIFFQGMFCVFSLIYLINAIRYVLQEQYNSFSARLIICAMLLLCINFIILCLKQNNVICSQSARIAFILILYTYIVSAIILSFTWMFISETKSSLNEYINKSFKASEMQSEFKIVDLSGGLKDYLSYDKMKVSGIFTVGAFDQKKLSAYINTRFAPVDKLEDFIFYSAENCFGGINVRITAEGEKIKYELILQKFLFVLVSLVAVVNLSGRRKGIND